MNAQPARTFRSGRSLVLLLASVAAAVAVAATVLGVLAYADGRRSPATQIFGANALSATADLSITQTNNLTQVVPGSRLAYTVTAHNLSSEVITGAVFVDSISPNFVLQNVSLFVFNVVTTSQEFTHTKPISLVATMGPSGYITLVLTGILNANATGVLTNTASIAPPAGVTDPTPGNNTATDADPIVAPSNPTADLQISKTDGVTEVKTAQPLTYTVIVTNAGPMAVQGVRVTDVLPSGYQAIGTSVSFPRNPPPVIGITATAGLITVTYDMLPGDVIRVVVTGTVRPYAITNLTNTVQVTLPATMSDPNPANNLAVDVDALILLPRMYLPMIRK